MQHWTLQVCSPENYCAVRSPETAGQVSLSASRTARQVNRGMQSLNSKALPQVKRQRVKPQNEFMVLDPYINLSNAYFSPNPDCPHK